MSSINNVVVIGAGLMGSGIAQVCYFHCSDQSSILINFLNNQVSAAAGYQLTLIDLNSSLLDKSKIKIEKSLRRVGQKIFKGDENKINDYVEKSLNRIKFSSDLNEAVKTADLVIEAIVEDLTQKQKLFESIDNVAKSSAIFASNTSALSIKEISKDVKRLDRFCGLHFFNPVAVMKLLEIVKIPETSHVTYQAVLVFGTKIGKTCVTCKDTPGFIVNRLLNPYMAEAISMLERGDATAEDIDTAMKLGAGYPMGPFELIDLIGLDTARNVRQHYHEVFPNNPQYNPSKILDEKVKAGKLGVKKGEGFYKYK